MITTLTFKPEDCRRPILTTAKHVRPKHTHPLRIFVAEAGRVEMLPLLDFLSGASFGYFGSRTKPRVAGTV